MPTSNTKDAQTGKAEGGGVSQLEQFIRLANKAHISTKEPGSGEAWEVMDGEKAKKIAQDAQDDGEWVVVGKVQGGEHGS